MPTLKMRFCGGWWWLCWDCIVWKTNLCLQQLRLYLVQLCFCEVLIKCSRKSQCQVRLQDLWIDKDILKQSAWTDVCFLVSIIESNICQQKYFRICLQIQVLADQNYLQIRIQFELQQCHQRRPEGNHRRWLIVTIISCMKHLAKPWSVKGSWTLLIGLEM